MAENCPVPGAVATYRVIETAARLLTPSPEIERRPPPARRKAAFDFAAIRPSMSSAPSSYQRAGGPPECVESPMVRKLQLAVSCGVAVSGRASVSPPIGRAIAFSASASIKHRA